MTTQYEVVLTDGTTSYRVAYIERKSMVALLALFDGSPDSQSRARAVIRLTGATEVRKDKGLLALYGGVWPSMVSPWVVKFSGRTKRRAKLEGEHIDILPVEYDTPDKDQGDCTSYIEAYGADPEARHYRLYHPDIGAVGGWALGEDKRQQISKMSDYIQSLEEFKRKHEHNGD